MTGKGGSRLFCNACREELSLRRNVIANHVASNKHKTSKEKLVSRDSKERDIAQFQTFACFPIGIISFLSRKILNYRSKLLE